MRWGEIEVYKLCPTLIIPQIILFANLWLMFKYIKLDPKSRISVIKQNL
jgi:hypothetical protein